MAKTVLLIEHGDEFQTSADGIEKLGPGRHPSERARGPGGLCLDENAKLTMTR
jgi:hypothetical protein